ncbi:MAG: hypothetical protein ACI9HK_004042 [Pirellulaceae bacterium]
MNNLTDLKEFTERYAGLSRHYNLQMEKTNPNSGNENGDAESLHRHFKKAVDQALMLRGSRDFSSREEYEVFLAELIRLKNRSRHRD